MAASTLLSADDLALRVQKPGANAVVALTSVAGRFAETLEILRVGVDAVREGDVHLDISSPGWAKHAWSSFYSPFLAEATVFVFNYDRFDAATLMRVMDAHHVSTFCAPPTVWRTLIQADLGMLADPPRELVGAGEPLNPEVIAQVRDAWGATIRDGYGQTEMTCCIGNSPGQRVKDGSMGRPTPGYPIVLVDPVTGRPDDSEGEICLDLATPCCP